MKKLALIGLLCANSAMAAIYIDGSAGFSSVNYQTDAFGTNGVPLSPNFADTNASANNTEGVGYNFNIGYKFTDYIAAEFGYYGSGASQSFNYNETVFNEENLTYNNYNIGNIKQSDTHAFALAAKFIAPLNNLPVSLYGKIGIANVYSDFSANQYATAAPTVEMSYNKTASNISPLVGVGVDYKIIAGLSFTAGWTYIYGNQSTFAFNSANTVNQNVSMGGFSPRTPEINLLSAGLSYEF